MPSLLTLAHAGYDVLVVDQSSGDETERLLADTPVRYLRDAPRGLAHARNAAVSASSAPLLGFTDDDVQVPPTWLERIAREFGRAPEAGAICGRATTPGGQLLPGVHAGPYRWPTIPFGLGSGFNIAFRRSALDQVGPFDEELGAGAPFVAGEDSDMLYRILKAGWTVVCSDDITVVHHDDRRGRDELRLHYGYGIGAGAQTAKHVSAGDRSARRIALKELARHARTYVRALVMLRLKLALIQVLFMTGLVVGYRRRRAKLRRGAQPAIRS